MSETVESLGRKLSSAGDLQSVVRTMKAIAAASIGQYEKSVSALGDYYQTVELGLAACLRRTAPDAFAFDSSSRRGSRDSRKEVGAIVFGSDQGLVGTFNDVIAQHAIEKLTAWPGTATIWAVGERVHGLLTDAGLSPVGLFAVPSSVQAITPLVGRLQLDSEERFGAGAGAELFLFHNRPKRGASYEPVAQRLLPLDATWQNHLREIQWPTRRLPEVMGAGSSALRVLLREYLFISLFRACAESLASENASRLAAMQRAENNIQDLRETLQRDYHRLRQSGIDEELFDVIAGFEALQTESSASLQQST